MKRPWFSTLAGTAIVATLAGLARADVPAAMDRVPADAPIVFSMKNVGQFHSGITTLFKSLNLPMESMSGLDHIGRMLKTEGLNTDGSAAVAIMSLPDEDAEEDSEPPAVVIVPVKDYATFAKALGGKGDGVEQITVEDKPVFVKDLGGGFAAMGPKQDVVQGFSGKAGNGKAHETLMGPSGRAVAESNNAFVVANIQSLAPQIKKGFEGVKEQIDQASAMAGGDAAKQLETMDKLMEGYLRDATSATLGFNAGEAGVRFDAASQFKEGSEYASYFSSSGKAAALTAALPSQPFLFAATFDFSAPGVRKLLTQMVEPMKDAQGLGAINPLTMLEKVDGVAFSMGATPALMGGLFLNTSTYVKTSDPAGYIKSVKEAFTTLNGKTNEGVTFQTSFDSGATKVNDQPVDTWGLRMQIDPGNPAAQQMGQMQMMLFGPMGLSGYIAPASGGVVMTYSKNSDLMTKALQAAKAGDGLSSEPGVKLIAEHLPAGRTVEAYIGVKSILDTAVGFMGMMGAGAPDFQVPENVSPIGFGGTTTDGGMRITMFMPADVIKTIKDLGQSMNPGAGDEEGDPMDAPPKEKSGQPKF